MALHVPKNPKGTLKGLPAHRTIGNPLVVSVTSHLDGNRHTICIHIPNDIGNLGFYISTLVPSVVLVVPCFGALQVLRESPI